MNQKKLFHMGYRRGISPFRRKLLCLVVLFFFSSNLAFANPHGPQVVNGNVSFNTQGNKLTITNSPNSIINWQGFSIGINELTRFVQQSGGSAVLNRVIGQDPSAILGALQSNGRVFLINPNGILFGAGARIDVNGLIASTLNMSNQDFLAGRYNFTAGLPAGSIVNQGTITTPTGGQVYLIAPDIKNTGIINSPKGEVILAAGRSVQLVDSMNPDIAVVVSAPENSVLNLGKIIADSGRVGIYGGLINQKGMVKADSAVVGENGQIIFKATKGITLGKDSVTTANGPQGGKITIQSETGTTLVSGTMSATGSEGKGGEIQILGKKVGLTDNAFVDASGKSGGGTVLVGGDYQGKNPEVQNAKATNIGKDATIKADAVNTGDGGKVIVWSDGDTSFDGKISARGGLFSGNGGFVETSGHKLSIGDTARVSTIAPKGLTGNWLLDPNDFTIAASGGDMTGGAVSDNLATTNFTIQTSTMGHAGNGDIFVNDPVSWSANKTLTLQAERDIKVNANITATGNSAGLNLYHGSTDGTTPPTGGTSYSLKSGAAITLSGTGPSLKIGNTPYTVINSLGDAGSTTGTDLQGMQGNLSGKYALGSNIDAATTSGWGSGAGFMPVGTSTSFIGTFDGLGHTITGLYINRPNTDYVGLFGSTNEATIQNVGLISGNVTGSHMVSGLVGYQFKGTIGNSYSTGEVTGYANVGGLVGRNELGSISNSYSTGTVTGTGTGAYILGGLVGGISSSGTISNSYSTATVTVTGSNGTDIGGLVGLNDATISNSYSTGAVTGGITTDTSHVGGLVGYNRGSISNSYSMGAVTGATYVGGLVGLNALGATISNSYSTGKVMGTSTPDVGGLVGYKYSDTITGSYWDKQTSGQISSAGGTGKTTAQMKAYDTFSSGWDIAKTGGSSSVWRIYEGNTYPLLRSFLTPITLTPVYNGTTQTLTKISDYTASIGSPVTANIIDTAAGLSLNSSATAGSHTATLSGFSSTQQGYDISYASPTITATGSAANDLNIAAPLGWSAGKLTINAQNNININSTLNGSGTASLALYYGQSSAGGGTATYSVNAQVNLPAGDNFSTKLGSESAAVNYKVITTLGEEESSTGTDLQGMKGALSGKFALGSDIDAIATAGWNNGFAPVGSTSTIFTGAFDGLGHTVTNLKINRPATDDVGLFGYANAANIRNVGLIDGDITGKDYVGGLVGRNYGSGGISNSYSTGQVTGNNYVGGLVGDNSGSISNSYSTGQVTGNGNYVGGLVGLQYGGNISNSYSTGAVSGTDSVGGLAGYNSNGDIGNSYSTGQITGDGAYTGGLVGMNIGSISDSYSTGQVTGNGNYVGGLVGHNDKPPHAVGSISRSYSTGQVTGNGEYFGGLVGYNNSSISDSYSTGSVTGTTNKNYFGGLVGYNEGGGSISNSYSTGLVPNTGTTIGGLVGINTGTVSNSFWDTITSNTSQGSGTNSSGTFTATGKTTTYMMAKATYTDSGWDIANTGGSSAVWRIYEGKTYPLLRSFLTPITLTPVYNGTTQTLNKISDYTTSIASPVTANIIDTAAGLSLNSSATAGSHTATLSGFSSTQQGYDISYASPTITGTGSAANDLNIAAPLGWSAGKLTINAQNNININNGINSTSGSITLTAGGTISQSAAISGQLLTTSSVGGTTLNSANTVTSFNATNTTSGNIALTNTASPLTITGISQSGGGNVVVSNAGAITTTGGITTAANGNISLTATSGTETIGGLVTAGGSGTVDLIATGAGNNILVNAGAGINSTSGAITASAGGNVTLTTASTSGPVNVTSTGGAILDGNDTTLNITGGVVTLNASTGIATDVTATTSVDAQTTTGNITLASPGNMPIDTISTPGTVSLTSGGTLTASGTVNVGVFDLIGGTWSQVSSSLPAFTATDFRITAGTFIRANNTSTVSIGTSENPYQLADIYGVQGMGSTGMLSKYYTLANDIDAAGTANWNSGAGFAPVGTYVHNNPAAAFTGTFDGLGHTITGLKINRPTNYVGLFGYHGPPPEGAHTIKNVGLVDVSITGGSYVGGLVGYNNGTISNAYSEGSIITGDDFVGGLVGWNQGTIGSSYATGSVSGNHSSLGEGGGGVGGLVGYNSTINAIISNSYSTASVTGVQAVGGLVGATAHSSKIENSFSTGWVNGSDGDVGGLVGYNYQGTVSNSYWDKVTSYKTTSAGSTNDKGMITTDMMTQGNFADWDFTNTWGIVAGNKSYPYLKSRFSETPQIISGTLSGNYAGKTIQTAVDGSLLAKATTGANGFYYFAMPSNSIPDNGALLSYVSGDTVKGASVYLSNGGHNTGQSITDHVVTTKSSGADISNTTLKTAKGSLTSTDIPYYFDEGNDHDLIVNTGYDFQAVTGDNSYNYNLNGNITSGGAQTYNRPLVLSANATLTSNNLGVTFNDTVTAGNNTLSVYAGGSNGISIYGAINSNTSLSLTSSGPITQQAAITAGTLNVTNTAAATDLSSNENVITNLGTINAASQTFSLENTTALAQTGVLTAETMNITNTSGATILSSQDNVIAKLGTINAVNQAFSLKNTTALTQTGVLTADTLNLTNTAGATNLSSQDNVITKLGTINATGQTFSLKNTTNLTQAVESAITADGISLSGTGSYTLTNTGNTINKFASDATGTINFYNNMCMAVDTVGSVTGITLVNNSVTLTAGGSNGNLTISQAIGKSTGSADANLTLNANNNININANISSTAGKLNLTLNADSDGMGGGTSTIASNKTVNANYGNLTYNKGLTVNGTLKNSTLISGDGTTLSGAASFDNMTIGSNLTKSGNLDIYNNLTLADGITLNTTGSFPTIRFKTYGPQTVSTAGSATWAMANGTIYAGYNYAQTLTLGAGLTLSGYGSLTKMFNSTEIINNGAILANTTGQSWSISPTIFSNAGTVQSTFGNISISPLTFNNTGSLLVGSGSTMSAAPGDPFTNTGTIDVANGATFSKTTGFTNTGTLTGAGTITVGTGSSKLVNQGNINPGGTGTTGTLAITGDVQLDTGSNLNIELGGTAAGEYDVLAVSGTATLGGALNVSEVNGFLTRKDNNFTVLTAGSRSGDFSTSSYPTDVSFSATPTGNLTLTANSTTTRWNSDYDGDWTNSSYWSRGVPTSTDNVFISRPYANPTISIFSGSQAANEFTCDETLNITGGSLSLGGASTVKYLTLSGGSLGGSGTLAVTGSGTWSGGTLGGALQVDSGATLLINGSGAKSFNGGTLTNNGTVNWSAGTVEYTVNNTFNNNSGGIFDIQGDLVWGNYYGGYATAFTNAGTLKKTSGTGTLYLGSSGYLNLSNSGTVDVQTGTMRLYGNSTVNDTGALKIASGTTLNFAGGTHNLNSGTSQAGAGTFAVSGATVNINTPLSAAAGMNVSGGALNVNSSTNTTTPTLNLSGGTLGGSGTLDLTGTDSTWSGGTLSGLLQVDSGATLLINGSGAKSFNGGTLTNNGTVNWSAGTVEYTVNNTFNNNSGGIFDIQGDLTWGNYYGGYATAFTNAGTLKKTSGTGTLYLGSSGYLNLSNSGTVDVQTGTMEITGSLSTSGTIEVASGTTFKKTGGFTNTGTIGGTGTIDVGSGTLTNTGTLRPGAATGTTTGTLSITGNLTNSGDVNIGLGGASEGEYDVVAVSGAANLGGTLNVSEVNGFITRKDNSFTVLTAGTRSGNFNTYSYPADVSFSAAPTGNLMLTANSTTTRWNSDTDGDWTNSSYWSRGVPTSADNVVISRPYANPTISILSGSQAANEFTSDETLNITGGSLSLGGASTVKYLTLSGGTLGGTGTLELTGSGTWSGGTLSGLLQVDSGATFTMSGGAKTFNGTLTNSGGTVNLNGETVSISTLNLSSGTLQGSGSLTVSTDYNNTGGALGTAFQNLSLAKTGNFAVEALTAANSVTLASTGNITQSGAITTNTLHLTNTAGTTDLSTQNNVISNLGTIDAAGQTFSLKNTTALSQTGAITANTLNLTNSGGIDLSGANNARTVHLNNDTSGAISYASNVGSGNTLSVDGSNMVPGGNFSVTESAGNLTIATGNQVRASATGNVYLASGGNFINNAGANAVSLDAGRFLIYSIDPGQDTKNGLTGGNLYNRTYAANPPASIAQTGNRFIYSIQPTLLFTADDKTKTYGDANVFTSTVTGYIGGDNAAYAYTGVEAYTLSSENAGIRTIAPGIGSLASSIGYNFNFANGTMTINKAPLSVMANEDSKTYNGLTYTGGNGVTYTGFVNGETQSVLGGALTYGGSSQGARNVGTYAITPSGLTSGNYAFTFGDAALTVNKANLTITAATNTKTYDGTITAAATPTYSGLQTGDTLTGLSEAYDTKHAGTGKTLTVASGYTLNDGNSGNNYNVATVNDATGLINKANLTITAATNTKGYDRNTRAAATPTITSGSLAGEDTATLTEVYDSKVAGTNKTLTPAADISDGNSGNNYRVTYVNSTTGVIEPGQIVSGMLDVAAGGKTIDFAVNGTLLPDQASTDGKGNYSMMFPLNSIPNSSALLAYVANDGSVKSASVYLSTGGDISNLLMSSNTVTAGSGDGTMSNTTMGTAKGSLAYSDIPYSVSGTNLTLSPNFNFKTTSGTTYSINGKITTTNGAQNYNGPVTLPGNAVISAGTGNISFGGPVTGTGYNFTLDSQGTVTQTAPISVSGLELLGTGGTYTLTDAANAVKTLAGNTGTVDFTNSAGISIGTVNTAGLGTSGNVKITTEGGITLNGLVSAGTGAGTGRVTLSSGGAIINGMGGSTSISAGSLFAKAGNGIGHQKALQTKVANLTAENTGGSNNIEITNTGALNVTGGILNSGSGDIILDNTGAVDTGANNIKAAGGSVTITAHSPLTVGSGGVTAEKNVTLEASPSESEDKLTVNGPVKSNSGDVNLKAADEIEQNSSVDAPSGNVNRTVNGSTTTDGNDSSSNSTSPTTTTQQERQAVVQSENANTTALNNTNTTTVEQQNAQTEPPPPEKKEETTPAPSDNKSSTKKDEPEENKDKGKEPEKEKEKEPEKDKDKDKDKDSDKSSKDNNSKVAPKVKLPFCN